MARSFEIVSIINQPKKNYYNDQRELSQEVRQHFLNNAKAEKLEFGDAELPISPAILADINSEEALELAEGAEVVLLFGTAILGSIWLDRFPQKIFNLHLGLSPFYRGSATLFWPFVNEDLSGVGATIHLATAKVDAGAILRRIRAEPQVGDSYYSLTNRLIREAIDVMPSEVRAYLEGTRKLVPQEGKLRRAYRKSDFNQEALRKALAFVGTGLTEETITAAKRQNTCPFSQ